MAIRLECSNGFTLVGEDDLIKIITKKGEESVPCSAIRSVIVKEPGLNFGKFEFAVDRQNSIGMRIGMGIVAAMGATKTFFYRKQDKLTAERMRDYILECQKPKPVVVQQAEAPAASDPADQIRKLKSLLDDGILTAEEFAAKKKQILGI